MGQRGEASGYGDFTSPMAVISSFSFFLSRASLFLQEHPSSFKSISLLSRSFPLSSIASLLFFPISHISKITPADSLSHILVPSSAGPPTLTAISAICNSSEFPEHSSLAAPEPCRPRDHQPRPEVPTHRRPAPPRPSPPASPDVEKNRGCLWHRRTTHRRKKDSRCRRSRIVRGTYRPSRCRDTFLWRPSPYGRRLTGCFARAATRKLPSKRLTVSSTPWSRLRPGNWEDPTAIRSTAPSSGPQTISTEASTWHPSTTLVLRKPAWPLVAQKIRA
ncbi:hypothetical protein GGI35DRAFT_465511 [Trichoderma velutinum]